MKLNSHLIAATLLLGCIALPACAQEALKITLGDTTRLEHSTYNGLGGLSSLEWLPGESFGNKGKHGFLALVSDRTKPGQCPGSPTVSDDLSHSYIFQKTSTGGFKVLCVFPNGESDVESIRYSRELDALFYSWESNDDRTGIRKIPLSGQGAASDVVPASGFVIHNRGIEAIAIAPDSSLWYTLESGLQIGRHFTIPFYKIPYNQKSGSHDVNTQIEYRYPFDRCRVWPADSCETTANDTGCGVSEMIALPKSLGEGFLVLERCWRHPAVYARLYHVQMDGISRLLSKTLVYDFNMALGQNPDNLEGMAWGPEPTKGSPHTLYVVSDDNYQSDQQTTWLIQLAVSVQP